MPEPTPKVGGKKLPKQFWIIGIAAALVIGLYLRSRSQASSQTTSSQQTGTATDVTSNPYAYTASGAYPDTNIPAYDYYGSSPYGMSSLSGNNGLPTGFDPTSFEEGITYAQGQLGLPTLDASGAAPITSPVGGTPGVPGSITLNIGSTAGKVSGKPNHSGKAKQPAAKPKPKPKPKVKPKLHLPKPKPKRGKL